MSYPASGNQEPTPETPRHQSPSHDEDGIDGGVSAQDLTAVAMNFKCSESAVTP